MIEFKDSLVGRDPSVMADYLYFVGEEQFMTMSKITQYASELGCKTLELGSGVRVLDYYNLGSQGIFVKKVSISKQT